MTPRTPTLERPPLQDPPTPSPSRLRPWHAVVVVGLLLGVGVALVLLLLAPEPVDLAPATPDTDAAAPQEPAVPAEPAPAPAEPQDPQEPQDPAEPAQPPPAVVYGEEARANWDVTGVAADDRLNVRSGPGVANPVKASLAPNTAELESTGRIATVGGVLWREIVIPGDGTGWVNASYLTETRPPDVLPDGRHPTYLHEIDVEARRLTVDVIQFLTGQAAIDAHRRAHPDDPDGPPNDYVIVNDNPRLRDLQVAPDVQVELVRLGEGGGTDLDPGTWEELQSSLSSPRPTDGRLSWSPFWITVRAGVITRIEEQYIP